MNDGGAGDGLYNGRTVQFFQDILGQSRVIDLLQSALASGHVHHAWIFHGPPGVGKYTTARALATVLLDPDAQPNLAGLIDSDPDGRTANLVAHENHPDLHVVRKELAIFSRDPGVRQRKQTSIPVEVVREYLVEPAVRSGHAARDQQARASKVFIVDEAELLAETAQNVLLKTLEEPPAGTVIILVTAYVDRLLPTIRSRCQRVAFNRLTDADMQTWLDRYLESAEGALPTDAERAWLVRFADGSPGMAELAITNRLFEWYLTLAPMLRELWAGRFVSDMGKRMAKLVDEFAANWVSARKNASKLAANQAGTRYMFMLIAAEMRLGLRNTIERGTSPDRVLHMLDLLQEAERQLNANVNMEMLFENLVIQWSAGRNESSIWFATAGM